ncbi:MULTISPECIES: 5-methyltetrahydropteroyltriglutamate--homocysteine S-methyltransferase [Chelativorans]|uniref:5-methyltetrahydropteroyltriglutamate--homocysteine methyltransferase n=1 Tax=Chelativorans sp. (strain BNC1) TaxID=266779 RepID=METE_CHESB|nr:MULTISPECIES: 5-methyltetrahydropteroyltriglutamate--homocysteine S-methyltransferase [Chelativorans]Q11EU7.1 RecName: Full=5-methyltetrahydropteroyltriglutamate--homocysteine methyltransferase; AltName: Full=Cobalamin-independent methionine synthase; AltName: Full=Methionine synthase, vitamin-B12 independent isozyme [Chelativorans sp. BNC1]
MSQIPVATLGVPRIGRRRELKFALEAYWGGESSEGELLAAAAKIRAENWSLQKAAGASIIPSNDFTLYDHVLDMAVTLGAIPEIYGWAGGAVPLDTYFAMARGSQEREACGHSHHDGTGVPALEMTKWFDTNYHYMVPEFDADQTFRLASLKPVEEFDEAKRQGIHTRPVLLGPVSFLKLGKRRDGGDPLELLPRLVPVYAELLGKLLRAGADWVQIDEPCLVLDLTERERRAFTIAYDALAATGGPKLMLATYFGGLGDNLPTAAALPVAGLHLDLVRAPDQLQDVLSAAPEERVISLGVVDGRNIWRTDIAALLDRLGPIVKGNPGRFQLAPSCSLLHVPLDLSIETGVDPELRSWLAFAVQKVEELSILSHALSADRSLVQSLIDMASRALAVRASSTRVNDPHVAGRLSAVTPEMAKRSEPFSERRKLQQERLNLPAFPTTTIGSFPQTAEVRQARAACAKGELSEAGYDGFLKGETEKAIRWQEEIGIDVLVHGEFERNDMVQYFSEQLSGYAFTKQGWVQSYGSRCVRPPIIFGDVSRPQPMTVDWATYAQSLTDKPVKGMLTGPVTMLQWSFVRDDLPRETVCRQIAFALRDEVSDLEAAGIGVIQIDEPALREGLPLREAERPAYLDWAVECFRLASSGVKPETQIHTHMCYAEFNDIIDAIAAMDADVISIETSRSKMELLRAFRAFRYPNDIGPGVFDIHSPRVPPADEMADLLRKAEDGLDPRQIWVNPDCGLKTRKWEEVRFALANMVEAARQMRAG